MFLKFKNLGKSDSQRVKGNKMGGDFAYFPLLDAIPVWEWLQQQNQS